MTCAWCDKSLEAKDVQSHNHLPFHRQCVKQYQEYVLRIRQQADQTLRR